MTEFYLYFTKTNLKIKNIYFNLYWYALILIIEFFNIGQEGYYNNFEDLGNRVIHVVLMK